MKSSYPLGSCPNVGLKINIRHYESIPRTILKNNIRHYDSFRRILKQDMTSCYNLCCFHYLQLVSSYLQSKRLN